MKKNSFDTIKHDDWTDVSVKHIDFNKKNPSKSTVEMTNGYTFSHKEWYEHFVNFWDHRIVGKAIVPIFYEYLFSKGGSNAYDQLAAGMEHQGFIRGALDQKLTSAQKWAIGGVVTIIFVMLIVFVVLNQQGMIPSFGG
ncbi:MAG: hypothetical protein KGY67_08650 [Candidatus Thermoplasmatota archaeon]|nr:hypothetical protein [Candidatus Thermoplasmatota archaeon]